ncbi:hypothetical protein ES708_20252 [subsurface metagenome]|uniref:Uncharacterized protein n=1 Tax=marine sediment metagenome TaxID=412755 RepID=X1TTV1_9ZZZZ
MADKRQVTLIELTVALDGQYVKQEVEQLFIPEIKKVCSMAGMKYAPEAWANKVETVTMDVVPKG